MSDYRKSRFDLRILTSYAKTLGKNYYWRIYISENIIRVVVHSILSVQVGQNWWDVVVDKDIKDSAKSIRNDYLNRLPNRSPGNHDIYCTYLSGLERILAKNRHAFTHKLRNVDEIIISLNKVRVPRNLTSHMNIVTANDRSEIAQLYKVCKDAIKELGSAKNFQLQYPS